MQNFKIFKGNILIQIKLNDVFNSVIKSLFILNIKYIYFRGKKIYKKLLFSGAIKIIHLKSLQGKLIPMYKHMA